MILDFERIAVDDQRLCRILLRLRQVHTPLGKHIGDLRRHAGRFADHANKDFICLHHVRIPAFAAGPQKPAGRGACRRLVGDRAIFGFS